MSTSDLWTRVGDAIDFELFRIAGTTITVGTLLAVAGILLATHLVSRLAQRGFDRALQREDLKDPGTLRAIHRLVHYVILLVGLGVALETVGFDLTALFTAGAVFAIGLGFAMQNIAQNFVSGIILLLERSIKPHDILQVEGRLVRVERMGIRATVARTLDDEEVILPNSALVQNAVTNYTHSDSFYRLRATVGVVYGSDMAQVREVLERAAQAIPWRVQSQTPRVLLGGFGDSSVDFEVGVWISDPWAARLRRSELNEAIWWALQQAGITIAFPQLDLHLDPPVVESLRLAASPR